MLDTNPPALNAHMPYCAHTLMMCNLASQGVSIFLRFVENRHLDFKYYIPKLPAAVLSLSTMLMNSTFSDVWDLLQNNMRRGKWVGKYMKEDLTKWLTVEAGLWVYWGLHILFHIFDTFQNEKL